MPRVWNKRKRDFPDEVKYVGRPTIFGNPFVVGVHGEQGECVRKHREWLKTGNNFGNHIASEERRRRVLKLLCDLKGRDLLCWCAPAACHADTLVEMSNV